MIDRIETVEEDCKHPDCSYRRSIGNGVIKCCDYIGATGHSRGCRISECDKYTTKKVKYPQNKWVHLDEI